MGVWFSELMVPTVVNVCPQSVLTLTSILVPLESSVPTVPADQLVMR